MKRPLLLALVLIPFVHGCGCESGATSAMKKRPKTRLASPWAAAPAWAHSVRAAVEVEITSKTQVASGRQLPIETTTWSVQPILVLEGGTDARIPLAGGLLNSWDEAGLVRAADASWKVIWAPDGRGVACLEDGGDGWLWICCDGPQPFHCPHLRVAKPGDADPCAKGPKVTVLAMEMMASPDTKSLHPEGPDANEWIALGAVVGVDYSNLELVAAFAKAALREHSGLVLSDIDPASLEAIQSVTGRVYLVITHPKLQHLQFEIVAWARAALEAKGNAGAVVASNACQLLARSREETDQRAIARALLSTDWAPPATVVRDSQWPRAVAWSLARSLDARGSAFEDVEATMLAFLKRADDKPESTLPILFALATHGSPKAREVLIEMAKESDDPSPPAWPASLDELWKVGIEEHGALTHGMAAWAKAATAKPK